MSAVAAAPAAADVGSPESYAAELYERHSQAIYRLCLRQLRRREDADDAVQTTFIYALLSLRRGELPRMELPWLLTIAKNVCSTRRRSGMRRATYESPQDLDSIQDRLAAPDRADVASPAELRIVLQQIPESQRQALLLREWRGFSYDEIGSELGLSQSATEALLFRARQNVAQRLGAGLKALNGLPLVSFVRGLFETGTAKLVAAAAGATLAIAAVPAAQQSDAGTPVPRVVPPPAVAATTPALRHRKVAPPRVQRSSRPAAAAVTHLASAPSIESATPSAPAAPRTDISSPPEPRPAPSHADAATPPPPSSTSVDDATSDVGVNVPLAAVTTPTVTTPELGIPVSVPPVTVDVAPLPKVQLP